MAFAPDITGTESSPPTGWSWGTDTRPCTIEPGAGVAIRVTVLNGSALEWRHVDHNGAAVDALSTLAPGQARTLVTGERASFTPRDPGGAAALLDYSRPEEQAPGRG